MSGADLEHLTPLHCESVKLKYHSTYICIWIEDPLGRSIFLANAHMWDLSSGKYTSLYVSHNNI